eukprot:g22119.t1
MCCHCALRMQNIVLALFTQGLVRPARICWFPFLQCTMFCSMVRKSLGGLKLDKIGPLGDALGDSTVFLALHEALVIGELLLRD